MAFEFEFTIQVTLDSTIMHISTMVDYFSMLCVCVMSNLGNLLWVERKGT